MCQTRPWGPPPSESLGALPGRAARGESDSTTTTTTQMFQDPSQMFQDPSQLFQDPSQMFQAEGRIEGRGDGSWDGSWDAGTYPGTQGQESPDREALII